MKRNPNKIFRIPSGFVLLFQIRWDIVAVLWHLTRTTPTTRQLQSMKHSQTTYLLFLLLLPIPRLTKPMTVRLNTTEYDTATATK